MDETDSLDIVVDARGRPSAEASGWARESGAPASRLDLRLQAQPTTRARSDRTALTWRQVLPLAPGSLTAASLTMLHNEELCRRAPTLLAHLHGLLRVDGPLELRLLPADRTGPPPEPLLEGAGFTNIVAVEARTSRGLKLRARRLWTLPDQVRPGLELLICGLNPSVHSADTGVPFARPGNRFWPAALKCGLLLRDRDPLAALDRGVGFSDCVKRTSRSASELSRTEYRRGFERIDGLIRGLRPRVTCFVGLDGWRQARDPRAGPGWIPAGIGGRPAYLMPSTSGRNAHATLEQLADHLARARRGPGR